MTTDKELIELTGFALDLAKSAGREIIIPSYRMVQTEFKPDGTEVTAADRNAEEQIRRRIERQLPGAQVLGEEFGGTREPVTGDQWIIDPIDGTRSFVLGVPLFGTLIGLLRDGEPVVGVMHLPALDESLFASRGNGCWYEQSDEQPERVRTDPVSTLEKAYVSASVQDTRIEPGPDRNCHLAPLVAKADRFRVVADCVQHAMVCRGKLHLAVDIIMSPWDSAALIPCVEEAGGAVAALDPEAENVTFSGSLISASTTELMAQCRNTLLLG